MDKAGRPAWRPEEAQYLEDLIGVHPLRTIVLRYNKWAKANDKPVRSSEAIESKVKRLGLKTSDLDDNFSVQSLAIGLGIAPTKLRKLIQRGLLKPKIVTARQHSVSRKAATKLILDYPQYFSSCDPDRLFWILEDHDLVKKVKATEPTRSTNARPVRGYMGDRVFVYPGVREAARCLFVNRGAIQKAIKKGGLSAGMRWEYCNDR